MLLVAGRDSCTKATLVPIGRTPVGTLTVVATAELFAERTTWPLAGLQVAMCESRNQPRVRAPGRSPERSSRAPRFSVTTDEMVRRAVMSEHGHLLALELRDDPLGE